MMKILALISLICVGFSIQNIISENGREFLTSFLDEIKGEGYKLKDDCLGTEFDSDFSKLLDAINKENALLTAAIVQKIVSDAQEKCPKEDLNTIYKDTSDLLNSGKFVKSVLSHTQEIMRCLKEEINEHQINASNVGRTLGKLLNIIVYNAPKEKNLNFLAENTGDDLLELNEDDVEEFVNGFFEGVSSVPYEQNLCKNDITTVKSEIVNVFADLLKAIKTHTGIGEAIMELYQLSLKLRSLDANCRFEVLASNIMALSTKLGMTEAIMRVTRHIVVVIEDITGMYSSVRAKEFRKTGVDFGSFSQILLNYSTK